MYTFMYTTPTFITKCSVYLLKYNCFEQMLQWIDNLYSTGLLLLG